MRALRRLVALASLVLLAATTPLQAADVTGRYAGIEDTDGTVINLQQDGTALTGQILGNNVGELTGTVDGETFAGNIVMVEGPTLAFEGKVTPQGVDLTIAGTDGPILARFSRDDGVVLDASQHPQHLYSFKDNVQFGALNLPEVLARHEAGLIGAGALVWKPQLASWVALNTLPEFAGILPPPAPGSKAPADSEANVDPLRGVLQAILDAQFAFLSLPDRILIADCAMSALSVLSEADRILLAETDFNLPDAAGTAFEERNPGVDEASFDCASPGKADGVPRSSIELLDGRIFAVSGIGAHALDMLEDGAILSVGETKVSLVGEVLAINDVPQELPPFEHSVEVQVADDGTTTVVLDQ